MSLRRSALGLHRLARPHASAARPYARSASSARLRAVFLNAERLDYDGRLDYAPLTDAVSVTWHAASEPDRPDEIVSRVSGHDVVINKEMPLTRSLIESFPPSVRLICEAGTGYNNVDVAAAAARGIAVCNIPTYATEAMAHMAITIVMSLSCSLGPQAATQYHAETLCSGGCDPIWWRLRP